MERFAFLDKMDQALKDQSPIKITMVVTSDLSTDQRVQRHAELLASKGYDLTVIGRKRTKSLPFNPTAYKVIRLKSIIEKSWLFYVSYNIKLLWYLFFRRSDVIWSNDLDTLLPSYLIARLKSNVLIYDTHEYYTGVPELQHRPFVKALWTKLEKWLLPQVKHGITVSDSVAQSYKAEYGIELKTVRNIPAVYAQTSDTLQTTHKLPESPFIIYQGALNKDRGLEEMILAMQWLDDYSLVIVGKGDVEEQLKQLVVELKLSTQVIFLGLLSPAELRKITPQALLGISIEKPTNPNYIMCLPNKLFDYMQAGIPIVAFPHPEIKRIIDAYGCGAYIDSHEPEKLAMQLKQLLHSNSLLQWKEASRNASQVLNWEKEKEVLINWFEAALSSSINR